MKHLRIYFLLCYALMAIMAHAQEVRTVSGEFTFYGEPSMSPAQCKEAAIEGARLAAMAKEFGTSVTQSSVMDESIKGDKENTFFKSVSETEVRGEWLEDIGEPQITRTLDSDGNLVITCKIKGRARALSNKAADFTALVLRNGTDKKYSDTRFRSGDQMRLLFSTPVDGYVAVYLVGDDRVASTLMPYSGSNEGAVKVKHGREYVFFDPKFADREQGEVDEILLATDDVAEHNRMYVLFSPNEFVKANDSYAGENLPRTLPFNDFHRWLAKQRKSDPRFGMKTIDIVITSDN